MARLLFVALAVLAACGHGANYQALPIGSPCKHDSDCGTAPFKCITDAEGYPNGYCTEGCTTSVTSTSTSSEGTCPADSVCVTSSCRRGCAADAACRADEGYRCVDGKTLGTVMASYCDYPTAQENP